MRRYGEDADDDDGIGITRLEVWHSIDMPGHATLSSFEIFRTIYWIVQFESVIKIVRDSMCNEMFILLNGGNIIRNSKTLTDNKHMPDIQSGSISHTATRIAITEEIHWMCCGTQ